MGVATKDTDSILKKLVKRIPTLIVSFYTGIQVYLTLGAFPIPIHLTYAKWVVFYIALVASPLVVWKMRHTEVQIHEKQRTTLTAKAAIKRLDSDFKERYPDVGIRQYILVMASFVIWAFALGGPFYDMFPFLYPGWAAIAVYTWTLVTALI